MQRTVGPCHRDRKQKRNEKSEEKERHHSGGGGGERRGCLQVTALWGRRGTWLWGEVEKGNLPRPPLVLRGQRTGRIPEQARSGRRNMEDQGSECLEAAGMLERTKPCVT